MKNHIIDGTNNPSYNNVLNLTNRTFDGNIVPGRGATEDQLLVVYNKIEEIRQFLEESGCSDDPFELIKKQLDDLEQAQAECCGTDWSASVTQNMFDKMQDLEDRIENCCTVDHGEIDIQNILNRIDALEQQLIACCNEVDARVQHVIDNIQSIPSTDFGPRREIGNTCPQGQIDVTYELDTSGQWKATQDAPKTVGRIIATINTSGKSVDRFFFQPRTADDEPYRHGGYVAYADIVKIEGHRDIAFQVNQKFGYITMSLWTSGISDSEYAEHGSDIKTDTCGNVIVGPTRYYTKLFAVIIDKDGCKWEVEIPLSDFDFSGIDETGIDSESNPCVRY